MLVKKIIFGKICLGIEIKDVKSIEKIKVKEHEISRYKLYTIFNTLFE